MGKLQKKYSVWMRSSFMLSTAWIGWWCHTVLRCWHWPTVSTTEMWWRCRHLSESLWFSAERPIWHNVVSMSIRRPVS